MLVRDPETEQETFARVARPEPAGAARKSMPSVRISGALHKRLSISRVRLKKLGAKLGHGAALTFLHSYVGRGANRAPLS